MLTSSFASCSGCFTRLFLGAKVCANTGASGGEAFIGRSVISPARPFCSSAVASMRDTRTLSFLLSSAQIHPLFQVRPYPDELGFKARSLLVTAACSSTAVRPGFVCTAPSGYYDDLPNLCTLTTREISPTRQPGRPTKLGCLAVLAGRNRRVCCTSTFCKVTSLILIANAIFRHYTHAAAVCR
ncbi:hypothetical protein F4780DRAFT_743323 [Xylariomycetidae sp. FL0641]|nr:hypothetical protein F4780DRAFT_743323 [Xylariomycetidae sp. FL0641]